MKLRNEGKQEYSMAREQTQIFDKMNQPSLGSYGATGRMHTIRITPLETRATGGPSFISDLASPACHHSHTFAIFLIRIVPFSNCLRAKCKGQFNSFTRTMTATRYADQEHRVVKKISLTVGGQFPLHFSRVAAFNKIKAGFDFIAGWGQPCPN